METYPLNQSQISIFTEDLLKLAEEKKTLTAWDIYTAVSYTHLDVYKRQGEEYAIFKVTRRHTKCDARWYEYYYAGKTNRQEHESYVRFFRIRVP